MSMIDTWLRGAIPVRIKNSDAIIKEFAISAVPPSTAELNSIDAKELADGWPAPIVAKNRTRRSRTRSLWVSGHGVTLGSVPAAEIVGSREAFRWIDRNSRPRRFARWGRDWGFDIGYISPSLVTDPGYMAGIAKGNMEAGVRARAHLRPREYFSMLTGIDLPEGTLSLSAKGDLPGAAPGVLYPYGDETLYSELRAKLAPDHTLFFGRSVWSVPIGGGSTETHSMFFWYSVPTPPALVGVRFLAYDSTSWDGANWDVTNVVWRLNRTPTLQAVIADIVWRDVMVAKGQDVSAPMTLAVNNWGTSLAEDAIQIKFEATVADPVVNPLPLSVASHGLGSTVRLARYNVCSVGDPEFVESTTWVGPTSWEDEEITIDNPTVTTVTAGATFKALTDAQATVPPNTDALVGKLLVTTQLQKPLSSGTGLLSRLRITTEDGIKPEDLATEEFMPSDGDQPALTWAQAAKNAEGVSTNLYHRMMDPADYDMTPGVHWIFLGGKLPNVVVTAKDENGVVVDAPSAELIIEGMRNGASVLNWARDVNDVPIPTDIITRAMFGVSLTAARATYEQEAIQGAADFIEPNLFPGTVTDPRDLDEKQQAAFFLLHSARSRSVIGQLYISAMMYGRLAKKHLQ